MDVGPLGMVTNPKISSENEACQNSLVTLAEEGVEIAIPGNVVS